MLIPAFGITGAAVAWSISILFQNLVPTWQIFRAFHLHPLGRGTLAAAAAALVIYGLCGGAIAALSAPSAGGAAIIALALVAIYAAVLWRFRRLLAVDSLRASMRLRARGALTAENP